MTRLGFDVRVEENFLGLERLVANAAEDMTKSTAQMVVDRAEYLMRLPKSGTVYDGIRASAPGEAPAIRTRELVNSMHVEKAGKREWLAVADAPHSYALELGNGHIAPRPYFRPALDYVRDNVESYGRQAAKAIIGALSRFFR